MRKEALVTGQVYHIFSRSIAGFKIFNNTSDFLRFKNALQFYNDSNPGLSFSKFVKLSLNSQNKIIARRQRPRELVRIIAYCLMPTHFHLILEQLKNDGISIFIKLILDSYSRYFNIKHKRKGPLWESRFKNVLVLIDEQLLHLTRYLHLNPVSIGLVKKPQDWIFSSYQEYIRPTKIKNKICDFKGIIELDARGYKKFTEERIDYQKELTRIKSLVIDDYSG